ncbi:gp436 family protein [Serratia marcescens]|uniref:gp436 family protein n=1 Tax=Serratia marcescens TaxID=615 RepID=UPI0037D93B5A
MGYATRDDLLIADGSYLWNVAINRETNQLDEAAITQALEDTDEEINSLLSRRYKLPLETAVPRILIRVAVSIAFYWLADRDNQATELVRKRYEDAIKTLKEIASGQRDLGLPSLEQPTEGNGGKVIMTGENTRLFTRNSLKGVL